LGTLVYFAEHGEKQLIHFVNFGLDVLLVLVLSLLILYPLGIIEEQV
jgi:hypothetical protein